MKTNRKTPVVDSAQGELSADIAALFANSPSLTPSEMHELESAARSLDHDAVFIADYLKALAVEDILKALEETGVSQTELAKRIGKSRQYVSNVLNGKNRVNFTIDTLAQFSVALGHQLCVRILPQTQHMHVLRTLPVTVEPSQSFVAKPGQPVERDQNFVSIPSSSFQWNQHYELSRIRA